MKARISDIKQETHDVKTLTLDLDESLKFKSGQFIRLGLSHVDIMKPFSISSSGEKSKQITITMKIYHDGQFTKEANKLNINDQVEIDGPYGHFIFEKETKGDIVLIAAGSGMSTLHSILRFIIDNKLKNNINIIYSVKTQKDIIYEEEIRELKKNNKLDFYFTVTRKSKEWKGAKGRLTTEVLKKQIKNKESLFYICGPSLFVKSVMASLEEIGVKKESIKTERYGDDF